MSDGLFSVRNVLVRLEIRHVDVFELLDVLVRDGQVDLGVDNAAFPELPRATRSPWMGHLQTLTLWVLSSLGETRLFPSCCWTWGCLFPTGANVGLLECHAVHER